MVVPLRLRFHYLLVLDFLLTPCRASPFSHGVARSAREGCKGPMLPAVYHIFSPFITCRVSFTRCLYCSLLSLQIDKS
ncbi:hypothetical protein GE09DRAFT_1080946 [Coniochaeta sp. 2T2.1]|nr:hypothetical protein GE09DRAFT_1080946 [Coniochaeta sp. 2T2.1]